MKVKIITGTPEYYKGTRIMIKTSSENLEKNINNFLKTIEPINLPDREKKLTKVVDIKYLNTCCWRGDARDSELEVSAMIIYHDN